MTNKGLARILKQTANLLELTGANPFKTRAYSGGARTIERLEKTVHSLLESGAITNVKGIGKGLQADIKSLFDTGSFELLDELTDKVPAGLIEILRINGLGVKKVKQLWNELDIDSLAKLEAAALSDEIAGLKGFSEKSQVNILAGLALLKEWHGKLRFADAFARTMPVLEIIQALSSVNRAEPAGEFRRKCNLVSVADIIADTDDQSALETALSDLEGISLSTENNKIILTFREDFKIVITCCSNTNFIQTWWELTGSDAHCEAVLAELGSFPDNLDNESAIYAQIGSDFIAPELRENMGEIKIGQQKTLPNLVILDDLKGSLHNHSTYSDGAHTLRQMAEYARDQMGLSYFGICDHSQSLAIANGLQPERVANQQAEISMLNIEFASDFAAGRSHAFKIFSGIESDILANGSLDYSDDILASFDLVVASVHVGLNMTETEATERILTAIKNPYTTILGHATGRILLRRKGYPVDYDAIIDACVNHNVSIELNASPHRLDMDWHWIKKAVDKGVLISINPDAHAMNGLHDVRWGTAAARKGWLTADRCLNAFSLADFSNWLETRNKVVS